jgi:hypothetical protein
MCIQKKDLESETDVDEELVDIIDHPVLRPQLSRHLVQNRPQRLLRRLS